MNSSQTQVEPVGASSSHLILGAAEGANVANYQRSPTAQLQRPQGEVYALQAQLHGKHMELAMEQGDRDVARLHMQMMNSVLLAHRAFRIECSEAAGHCFFDSAGAVDRAARGGQF